MRNLRTTLAREWLTLLAAIAFGALILPTLFYLLFSPAEYKLNHSLIDGYAELFDIIFGNDRRAAATVGVPIFLGPYLLYQFIRSIRWSIRTIRDSRIH